MWDSWLVPDELIAIRRVARHYECIYQRGAAAFAVPGESLLGCFREEEVF